MSDFIKGTDAPERDDKGRFLPGHSGGPGRPQGKPNQATVDARQLKKLWSSHALEEVEEGGVSAPRLRHALEKLYRNDPPRYARETVRIMPKDVSVEEIVNPFMKPIDEYVPIEDELPRAHRFAGRVVLDQVILENLCSEDETVRMQAVEHAISHWSAAESREEVISEKAEAE